MKKFKILWELPQYLTQTGSDQMLLEKSAPTDLLNIGGHKLSSSRKKTTSAKCSKVNRYKMRHAYTENHHIIELYLSIIPQ